MDKNKNKNDVLESLEPVVLGPADTLTELGTSGGDDNSRSDWCWWC